jgi:hypothetical protein
MQSKRIIFAAVIAAFACSSAVAQKAGSGSKTHRLEATLQTVQ